MPAHLSPQAYIAIKNNADALAAQLEANEVACTEAERRIAELSAGREDSVSLYCVTLHY
jgi:hypothetical protein